MPRVSRHPFRAHVADTSPHAAVMSPHAAVTSRGTEAEARIRAAIAAGQHAHALALLQAQHGRAIHRFARRMLGDDAAADDVVQETMLRAFVALGALRGDTSVRAWIMTIAAHRALDELRRRRRRRLDHDGAAVLPEVPDPRPHPAHALARRQEIGAVAASVDAMPDRLRASLLLYFGHELTFAEAGAALGENGATTLVRVRRGLERLRRQLQRRGVDATALAG